MENIERLVMQATVFEGHEYRELLNREEGIGAEQLFQELLEADILSNAQMMWLLKNMLYYYGGKDATLLKAPPERLLENMGNILRISYMLVDSLDPALDDNTRLYISTKLKQATWGLSPDIRQYLRKKK